MKISNDSSEAPEGPGRRRPLVPIALIAGTVGLALVGGALFVHARGSTNNVPLSALPKVHSQPAASRVKKIQKDKRRAPTALQIREKRAQAPM